MFQPKSHLHKEIKTSFLGKSTILRLFTFHLILRTIVQKKFNVMLKNGKYLYIAEVFLFTLLIWN